jgi:hypothetical protein
MLESIKKNDAYFTNIMKAFSQHRILKQEIEELSKKQPELFL